MSFSEFVLQEYLWCQGLGESYEIYTVSIDASPTLDNISHNLIKWAKFQTHCPTDSAHSQLFRLLDRIARAGTQSVWAFDGTDQPSVKQNINVKTEEPAFYSTAWELISAFGDCWCMAPGEGKAELIAISLNGEVDAIITAGSNIFPLGTKCVLVIDAKSSTEANLVVTVYCMDDIKRKLCFT
uniref:XPG-I domain-containing protein n=1 Tax=Moniliophthora roreri TaxID=221103 RepID=A0A0W0G2J5_MONRR